MDAGRKNLVKAGLVFYFVVLPGIKWLEDTSRSPLEIFLGYIKLPFVLLILLPTLIRDCAQSTGRDAGAAVTVLTYAALWLIVIAPAAALVFWIVRTRRQHP